MASICIYPGSFDPITNGHVNIIRRALVTFNRVIVAVAVNVKKTALFTPEERVDLIRRALEDELTADERKRVKVEHFEGLMVEYAKKKKAKAIVRGLRAVSDFEYEFQMASMNRKLAPDVDTMFMMTDECNIYISSRTVKEVASFHGCVEGLVPRVSRLAMQEKYGRAGSVPKSLLPKAEGKKK